MKNFGHHDEFDISGITLEDVKKKIKEKKVFYNHFADKRNLDKWKYEYELKNIGLELLPSYLTVTENLVDDDDDCGRLYNYEISDKRFG